MHQKPTLMYRTNLLGTAILVDATVVMVLTLSQAGPAWLSGALIGVDFVLFIIFWYSLRARKREFEQSKDEFVSLVSHQLRTPLTSTRLFTEMLLDEQVGSLNPKQHEYLRMVEISTGRMIDLVSDFLNSSRLELGRLEIKPMPTHLEDIVESIVNQIEPLASQQKLKINFEKPDLPAIPVEPALYGQIVNNLISNALHYTPEGGHIDITLSHNANGHQLDVADTGIGIPVVAHEHLFKRFYRADNAKHVLGEGSGLGLYLIKRIIDTCGGKVWFETAEGKGTTFHVIIPPTGMTPSRPTKR